MIVRLATSADAAWLHEEFCRHFSWGKPEGTFERACEATERGEGLLFVAEEGHDYRGHGRVLWQSSYEHFRERGIPEIQDLNVAPAWRRRGIGSRLLDALESAIEERSRVAGIAVGLYADYGPAFELYVRRGYVPDGRGLFASTRPVRAGETVVVDDALTLTLQRPLDRPVASAANPSAPPPPGS